MPPSEKTPSSDAQKVNLTKEPLRSRLALVSEPVDVALSDITVGQSFYINGDSSVLLTNLNSHQTGTQYKDAMVITITEPYHITDNGRLNLRGFVLEAHPGEYFRNTGSDISFANEIGYSLGLTDAMRKDKRLPQIPVPISISVPVISVPGAGFELDQSLIARINPAALAGYKEAKDKYEADQKRWAIEEHGELPDPVNSVTIKKKSEKLATKTAAGEAKSLEDRDDNQLLSSTKPTPKTRVTKAEKAKSLEDAANNQLLSSTKSPAAIKAAKAEKTKSLEDAAEDQIAAARRIKVAKAKTAADIFSKKLDELRALNLPEGQYAVTSSGAMAAHGIREASGIDVIVSPYLWDTLSKKHKVTRNGDFQKIIIGKHTEILGPGSHFTDFRIAPMSAQLKSAKLIEGIPFVNLHMVIAFKMNLGREKDLADVGLIDAYYDQQAINLARTALLPKIENKTIRPEFVASTVAGYARGPVIGPAAVIKVAKAETIPKNLDEMLGELKALNLPKDQYAVTSSGAMAAHGIREASGIEVVVSPSLWDTLSKKHKVTKNGDFQKIIIGKHTEILGPGSYFADGRTAPISAQLKSAKLIEDIPFVNLFMVSDFKTNLGREKDLADVGLIDAYYDQQAIKVAKAETISRSLDEMLGELKALNLPKDQYAVTSSGAMAAHGIREASDIDVIVSPSLWDTLSKKLTVRRHGDFQKIIIGQHTKILGPGSHFADGRIAPMSAQLRSAELIEGIPFVNLHMVSTFKKAVGEATDLADVDLIAAYHKATHVPSTPATSATTKPKNPNGDKSFVFKLKSKEELRRQGEAGLSVVPRGVLPGTVKVGTTDAVKVETKAAVKVGTRVAVKVGTKVVVKVETTAAGKVGTTDAVKVPRLTARGYWIRKSYRSYKETLAAAAKTAAAAKAALTPSKAESRVAGIANVVEFFPGATSLEDVYKQIAAANPSGAGNFKIGPDLEDALNLHKKDLSHLRAVAELFNEEEIANVYANVQKYNLPSDISKNSAIHDILLGVSSQSSEQYIRFKKKRLASSIATKEDSYYLLQEEESERAMKLAKIAEYEEGLASIVSHGLVEGNGESGLLVSRSATKEEVKGRLLDGQLLNSNMYEIDAGAMLESMQSPNKTSGVKVAGSREFEEMRYFMSHDTAVGVHKLNPGLVAFMFREYTADSSRDQGTSQGALNSFLGLVNEFEENRELTEDSISGDTNSASNAGKGDAEVQALQAKQGRRNQPAKVAGVKPASDEKSMIADLARLNYIDQHLRSSKDYEEVLMLSQEKAEIEKGKTIEGLFSTSETSVKTLHARFKTLVVNGRELKIGESMSVGHMSDGNSSVARNTNSGRTESSQKRPEEHYEVPTVTVNEMLARYKDTEMQIDGLSTTDFFHKHARLTPNGYFWNESAKFVKDAASPGTVTISSRLIPGSLHSGTVTVDSTFYASLFKLPSNEYLPKDNVKLASLYESIKEIARLRETTIASGKGPPLSEKTLEILQALDRRKEKVKLDINGIRNKFAKKQVVQLSEESIPLRRLQEALVQIPELEQMLLLGDKSLVKDGNRKVAYGAGDFNKYLKQLGTDNPKNLKGIRNINLAMKDISETYLGRAKFDPILLLTQSQRTSFAMKDELAYQLVTHGYTNGVNEHGEAGPEITDVLELMHRKKFMVNPANPHEGVRDIVTNLFESRIVPQSVRADSTEKEGQNGEQYSFEVSSEHDTEADALDKISRDKKLEKKDAATYEFRSARDFFGKVSESTTSDAVHGQGDIFEAAREVLMGTHSDTSLAGGDKNAYLKRKGFFFGYKSSLAGCIYSATPLTAKEYNNKESVNLLVPSRETFKEISKLTISQQKIMGDRIGLSFEQADYVPVDISKKAPAGFYTLQAMLESEKLLPLDSRGIMVDPDSIPLSHAQQQIIEHVFRPAKLDGLVLDKDTPGHAAEIDTYLKDPKKLALDSIAEGSEFDLKKRAEERAAAVKAAESAAKQRVLNASQEAIDEAVAAFVHGNGLSYQIKHGGGFLKVESIEDDPSAVMINGVKYSFDQTTVVVPGSSIDSQLKRGVIAEGFSPSIRADEELSPLRQLVAGEKRMIISPEMGSSGTHATLEKMLHKMNNGGATIIGFDIETDVEYARDKQGQIIFNEDGTKKIDHSTVLHNVGSTTFTLTPEGVSNKTDGFDVAADAFKKSENPTKAMTVGSIGRTVGKGLLGSEEEHMVSFVFDKFSAADKDAFFGVFNATFDVGHMEDYARDAVNARLASIKEAEDKGMFDNSALKEQLEYFQKAHTFFKDEMSSRTVELSHLLEISGVRRTARKNANSVEEFLVALGILKRGEQTHGGKQDIEDTIRGVHKSVSEFTNGEKMNLESFSFDGKTAGAAQYVFPMHLKYETEDGKIKTRSPKAPFILDGLVETTITKSDGTTQRVVAMRGSKIDGNNERIGPSEIQGFHFRGSVIQQMATQDTRNDAYFITDLEHIDEGWAKTKSRENLRDLIERNVRRATRYEGRKSNEVDFSRRDQYEARANIARKYEEKLTTSKVAADTYITDVIKDLTETNESGQHYVKRSEFQPLARTSGDGKGTIDTSSAKKAFSFIRADDAKAIKDWLRSSDINKFGEAGFLMPHARATIIETADVLKERAANHDAIFMDTFHEAGRSGIIAPEQIRSASAMYRSIMETSYSKAEQEIEGPATATMISTQQGRQKITRLSGKMSQEQIYDALFEHSLTVTGKVQDVLDANEKDYSFNVPTAQEMANSKNPSTVRAQKLIKERNEKLDPDVVKQMQADAKFTANELSEETQKVIEARNNKLNSMLVQGIQDEVRVSAPELAGIGVGIQHQSLRSLSNEVHQLLSSSDRKVKVANDLYSGPLFTASGEAANYEHMATTLGSAVGMDLPKDQAAMATWAKSQQNMQELYYAMEKTMGQGAYRTTNYDSSMPEMFAPETTSLKNALKDVEKPTVARFARKVEYSESGKAELIANTMNEQYAESILENEKRAIRKVENKLSPMKIGGGLGALALAAFAAETVSDMGEEAKDRENDSVVGQPRSTTAHNAGPLDTELNQKGSDSNTAANQGWSRLHIDIELEHPGYAGSDKRLDTAALKAFSDDVGSTLSRHFDATPTYTSSQSSNQDNGLRYRVGDMLNRSSGRYR